MKKSNRNLVFGTDNASQKFEYKPQFKVAMKFWNHYKQKWPLLYPLAEFVSSKFKGLF